MKRSQFFQGQENSFFTFQPSGAVLKYGKCSLQRTQNFLRSLFFVIFWQAWFILYFATVFAKMRSTAGWLEHRKQEEWNNFENNLLENSARRHLSLAHRGSCAGKINTIWLGKVPNCHGGSHLNFLSRKFFPLFPFQIGKYPLQHSNKKHNTTHVIKL